jgi:GrpB-like predicted nucleotidyltransferase (UPF0157 family)
MKIELAEYNPQWNDLFLKEKELLMRNPSDKAFRIEHIGSTSVPGLGAKPIIDILLGVKKLSDAHSFIPEMIKLGYEYISKFEDMMPERRYFVKRKNGIRTHHIHTVELTSQFWRRHILFRDYLRTHDKVRDNYYNMKKELALKEWQDSNDYADAKTKFIKGIEKQTLEYISNKIEIAEAEAWYDMYFNAEKDVIENNNISFERFGKAIAVRTDSIPAIIVNRIIGLGIHKQANKRLLEKAFNFYKPFKNIFGIQISPQASPENLGNILIEKGMVLKSYWNKFYRTTEPVIIPDTELEIIEINNKHKKDFSEVVTTVFEIPVSLKGIFEGIVVKHNWYHHMAYDKNKPVAAGSMYVYGDTAWFGIATTLSEYRGRGAQSSIIARRINKAHELGCKWISVETAGHSDEWPNPSFLNLLKYGFNFMYQRPNFVHEPIKN